jgi:broad specificity phosphatase PhoE
MSQTPDTIVHLMRHGEVHNPGGVLYGRRDGFHLSTLGQKMAQKVADTIKDRDITHIRVSPLERTRETAQPLADARGLEIVRDPRVIESTNVFEGERFGPGADVLRKPSTWRHLWNPMRPSWGEPYKEIAERMTAALHRARIKAAGHEAVCVSHQLPVETLRRAMNEKTLHHFPTRRMCNLASLTSFYFHGDDNVGWGYSELAGQ